MEVLYLYPHCLFPLFLNTVFVRLSNKPCSFTIFSIKVWPFIQLLRVLFIGLVLLLIRMGQKFGPCNAQLSSKTRIPQNSTLTTAITTTRSIIGLDLPNNLQVQLSGLLRHYLLGRLCHSSTIFTIKGTFIFLFFVFFFFFCITWCQDSTPPSLYH